MIVPGSCCSRFSLRWSFKAHMLLVRGHWTPALCCRQQLNVRYWHPSGSLVFSAVGCEIWCLFFYWGKGGHRRPLERHKLRFYFSYIKGRGFYVWASTCSGEDNQLFLYKLQAYAKKLNMLCYLWDLFSCLSAAILGLIRLLSVLDAFMIFISSFVCKQVFTSTHCVNL